LFLKIKDRDGGRVVPFVMKPIQQRIDDEVVRAHASGRPALIQISKSRRLGTSSYVAARFSHRCFTRKYQKGVVMADIGFNARLIFELYERMYAHLPPAVQPVKAGSKGQQINLTRLDSQINVGSAESPTFGRGGDAQLIHLSESSYYSDPEGLMNAILPGMSARGDGILILESTSNGPEGWWADLWQRSEDGVSRFTPLFFAWYEDPDHWLPDAVPEELFTEEEQEWVTRYGVNGNQIAWLRYEQDVSCQGRDDRRRRDFPASARDSFSAVGDVAWHMDTLKPCYKRTRVEATGNITERGFLAYPDGPLLIWEHPMEGSLYVIGADPAGGLSDGDLCAAEVWRVGRKPGEWPIQVAEWSGHEDPVTFAKTLTMLGTYYRKALLACETNGVGRGCQAALQKTFHYPRLHRWIRWDSYKTKSETYGWDTSPQSLEVMIGMADWLIRTGHVVIRSPYLFDEFANYQDMGGGHYKCVSGEGHGDRLMSAMIAWTSWFQHCVRSGTPVLMSTGEKPIEQIAVGDVVVTRWGQTDRVVKTFQHAYAGELVSIRATGCRPPLQVTPDHRIWVRHRTGHLRDLTAPEWVVAGRIRVGDHVCVPSRVLPNTDLDAETLYLLGWYLADGWCSKGWQQIGWVLGLQEEVPAKRLEQTLARLIDEHPATFTNTLTGRENRVRASVAHIVTGRMRMLRVAHPWLRDLIDRTCGRSKDKWLRPCLSGASGLLPLAVGFLEGDGYQQKNGAILVKQVNRLVLRQIRQILLDSGVWCTEPEPITVVDSQYQGRTIRGTTASLLKIAASQVARMLDQFPGAKFQRPEVPRPTLHARRAPEGFWSRVNAITTVPYSGTVHDLAVEHDHSFVAASVAVSNCYQGVNMKDLRATLSHIYGGTSEAETKKERADKAARLWTPDGADAMMPDNDEDEAMATVPGDFMRAFNSQYRGRRMRGDW
jgi:hypothetical protein